MSLPEVFTPGSLNGYTIQTSGSNSCDGANGVISAVPTNTNELPTFNLTVATGSLTYAFKGKTGTEEKETLQMICDKGNSLANYSVLFGSDSGLSCREAKSYNTEAISASTFQWCSNISKYCKGYFGETIPMDFQAVTISIGDKSWLVEHFEYEHTLYPICGNGTDEERCISDGKGGTANANPSFKNQQVRLASAWTEEAINVINESEGEFSAELDPDNPQKIKVYSSTGTQLENIKFSTNMTQNSKGSLPLKYLLRRNRKPTAYIALPYQSESELENNIKNGYYEQGGGFEQLTSNQIDKNDKDQGKTTTICDGR